MRTSSVAKTVVVAAAVIAALYLLYLVRQVIGLVVIAIFVAVALGPAVDFIQRRRLPRGLAILLAYVAILLAIVAVGLIVIPPIVSQVDDFVAHVPGYIRDLRHSATFRRYDDRFHVTPTLQAQAGMLPRRLGSAAKALESVTVGVFSAIFQLVTVLAMAFFLLLDGKRIVRWVARELGPARGEHALRIAHDVYDAVGGYVIGMGAIATLAGIGTFIVLTILGVSFAVPLAVLMAFLDLIPLIGATIGAIVVGIVAAFHNFPTALLIWLAYFFVYQQVENNVTQPLVFRRTVSLRPLVVIVSVLIGVALLGILGGLLAIPIAAAVQIVVKDWWAVRKRRLAAAGEGGAAPGAAAGAFPVAVDVDPAPDLEPSPAGGAPATPVPPR